MLRLQLVMQFKLQFFDLPVCLLQLQIKVGFSLRSQLLHTTKTIIRALLHLSRHLLEIFGCFRYLFVQEVICFILLLETRLILALPRIINIILASCLIFVGLYPRHHFIMSLIIR